MPGPPPPPGGAPSGINRSNTVVFAPTRKPTVKVSKVHWEPIKRRHTSTGAETARAFWNNLEPDPVEERNEIYSQLEEMFSPKRAKSIIVTEKPKTGRKKVIEVIDSKKSLTYSIFLKQFKCDPKCIIDALMAGDEQKWTIERLRGAEKQFSNMDEDIEAVQEYVLMNPDENLPLAESFFYEVAKRFKTSAEFKERF